MFNMFSLWEVIKRFKIKSGKCFILFFVLVFDWLLYVLGDFFFCRLCDFSYLFSLVGFFCGVGGELVSGIEGLMGWDLIEVFLFEKVDRLLFGEENWLGYFLIWCILENC